MFLIEEQSVYCREVKEELKNNLKILINVMYCDVKKLVEHSKPEARLNII
jgi:hypothetical protein